MVKDDIKQLEVDISKLSTMTRKQLNTVARNLEIQGYSKMSDHELIFSIMRKQTESTGYFYHEGVLEIVADEGYGFLRNIGDSLLPSHDDIYVSQSQIKRFNLFTGDVVAGQVRAPKESEKYFALLRVEAVNNKPPEVSKDRVSFENLTPEYPEKQIVLEHKDGNICNRIIDLISPIGFGQRTLIVAPPKTGKTTLMKDVANAIAKNHPNTKRIVLLIDERPEEVTDIRDTVDAHVIAAPFDMDPKDQIKVAEMTINLAKRMVEFGHDVVILMDSLTRLARAYNLFVPPSGKLLSGGVDPAALTFPKKFFGAARKVREGGSLTIIATALVETGSKMDEVIFEEFKGTGNMELVLSRELSDKRIFPAFNIRLSGTRKEELILGEKKTKYTYLLRRFISDTNTEDTLNFIMGLMKKNPTNDDVYQALEKQKK